MNNNLHTNKLAMTCLAVLFVIIIVETVSIVSLRLQLKKVPSNIPMDIQHFSATPLDQSTNRINAEPVPITPDSDNVSQTKISPSPIAKVTSLSKFTDADFGFSFWYPASSTISTDSSAYAYPNTNPYGSTTEKVKTIDAPLVTIVEVISTNNSIDACSFTGPAGPGYCRYYLDPKTQVWMYESENVGGYSPNVTEPAKTSNRTIDASYIFDGSIRFSIVKVIPISRGKFLVVYSHCSDPEVGSCTEKERKIFDATIKTIQATTKTNLAKQTILETDAIQAVISAYNSPDQ